MTVKKIAALALLLGGLIGALLLNVGRPDNDPVSAVSVEEARLFAEDDAESFGESSNGAAPESIEERLLTIRQGSHGQREALIAGMGIARYYVQGERLAGGIAELSQILNNAVLLKKGAVYQLLCCTETLAGRGPAMPLPTVLDLRGQAETTLTARRYHSQLYQNPISLIGTVQIESIARDGNRHYLVFPGTDPQAFSDFGLQAGDRILGVNGIDLADKKAIPKLFSALAAASHIAVTLRRGENEMVVLLALDNVSQTELSKGTLL